jgi:hypothetical protein
MLNCHQSQFYEWLPYNAGYLDQVPAGDEDRRQWLAERFRQRIQPLADRYRDLLIRTYGPEQGASARYIEAFEISEYGAPLDALEWMRLFPFLPTGSSTISLFTRKAWVDLPQAE